MWICSNCGRIFQKAKQPHSCKKVLLTNHFAGKAKAKQLFDHLVNEINRRVGKCKIISIPCCVHLFGNYDFLAALPKKDRLEIRIALGRKLNSSRIRACVPLSQHSYKNCFDIYSPADIDQECLDWIKESYFLKS